VHGGSKRSGFSGLRHLLGGFDDRGRIGMGRQLIAMEMGMGIMPGWEGRFGLWVMGRVGMRMIHGVVPFVFIVAFLVLAWL